jgi:hypothetical protein
MRSPEKTDVQEEAWGETGMHQWNKGPIPKKVNTSGKQDNTQQDLQENHRARDRGADSRVFCQDLKKE